MTRTLTSEAIHAIRVVVCVNKDSVEMHERRGVEKDDLWCAFQMAITQAEITEGKALDHTIHNIWQDSGLEAPEFIGKVACILAYAMKKEEEEEEDDDS